MRKQNKPQNSLPRGKWVNAQIQVTKQGKILAKVSPDSIPRLENPSQYTDDYLATTNSGRLLTPQTYLAYKLKGKARSYSRGYLNALMKDLRRIGASAVRSAGGGTAYVSTKQNPRRRNVSAGFVDEEGIFHPIRASYDYNRRRAGDPPKKRKAVKRKVLAKVNPSVVRYVAYDKQGYVKGRPTRSKLLAKVKGVIAGGGSGRYKQNPKGVYVVKVSSDRFVRPTLKSALKTGKDNAGIGGHFYVTAPSGVTTHYAYGSSGAKKR